MTKKTDMYGALYFHDDGTAVGYLKVGETHFQLAAVRANPIRTDIAVKRVMETQTDLFEADHEKPDRCV